MIRFLQRLTGGGMKIPPFEAPLEIDRATYAIGDVHGRHDLLVALMRDIIEDAARNIYGAPRIVLLGDYVDRGEHSADVLEFLMDLRDGEKDVVALRGNHEEMLLDFIDEPEKMGPRWLRNGGLQTLSSYGVGGVAETTTEAPALIEAAAGLKEALGEAEEMLRTLPVKARFGNVLFSHAGFDPEVPPEYQRGQELTWGSGRFLEIPRTDGLWTVFGHYVMGAASVQDGRIAVDTGAYFSGELTAARLWNGEVTFLST